MHPSNILSKLASAIEMCNSSNYKTYFDGLFLFDSIIMNHEVPPSYRVKAILDLIKINSEDGCDRIARVRDSLSHIKNGDISPEIDIFQKLVCNPTIESYQRLTCVVTLYNRGNLSECFQMFEHLANDPSVLIKYKIESCHFLLSSELFEYVETAKDVITDICIHSKHLPSEFRYNIIATFITTTGISTMMNAEALSIPYNEPFLKILQTSFFLDKENGYRERILSAQHLLAMSPENMTDDEKDKVQEGVLDIAKNTTLDENIRADACDVILRLGSEDGQKSAKEIIQALGATNDEKIKTTYTDKQNVHDSSIMSSVINFLESINFKDIKTRTTFHTVHAEITDLIYHSVKDHKERSKAFKSLNRISIDTATFSSNKVTSPEVFVYIWLKISDKEDQNTKKQLKKRLIEELIEMSDTCSSGHVARLINVLSGFENVIKISFRDQIISNVLARMMKRLESASDEIILGSSKGSLPEERKAFSQFLKNHSQSLFNELKEEFVTPGHIDINTFTTHFNEALTQWD